MRYRPITADDAAFLTEIFSIPEYELYFAENETTEAEWRDRIDRYFRSSRSYIVLEEGKKLGWVMYRVEGRICRVDLLVLHPNERFKGYGRAILSDILKREPWVREIRLEVQKRNRAAVAFYSRLGFAVEGEELQPVGNAEEPCFKMVLRL